MKKRGKILSFLVRLKFSAQMAFGGLTANVLRTCLTVLGIAIGVAAVVSLMGIGEGARQAVVSQFESLGQNVVVIKANQPSARFAIEEANDLATRVTGIEYATPVVNTKADIRWRRTDGELEILGVNEDYCKIRDQKMSSGNFFSSMHVKQRLSVAVLGFNVAESLMNGRSPVGQSIKINGLSYRIIGVLAQKGQGQSEGIDDKIVIPYTTALKVSKDRDIREIWAKASSPEDADLIIVQLGRMYKRKLGMSNSYKAPDKTEGGGTTDGSGGGGAVGGGEVVIGGTTEAIGGNATVEVPTEVPSEDSANPEEDKAKQNLLTQGADPITITSLNQLVKEADQANRVMTLLLGGIAAVSLLVGGIGIMNIMLVAVTERTSEIGVRRALGAKQEDLLIQFMLEAIYVSIIGCVVGIGIGTWGVSLATKYGLTAVVSQQSIKVAIAVALSSGLVFGVYPAINASSLPPVEALKRS